MLATCLAVSLGVSLSGGLSAWAKSPIYINASHEPISQPVVVAPYVMEPLEVQPFSFGAVQETNAKKERKALVEFGCEMGTITQTLGGEWMGSPFGHSTLEISATDCIASTNIPNETCTVAEPITAQLFGQVQRVDSVGQSASEEVIYPAASGKYQHGTLFKATISCSKHAGKKTKKGKYSGTYVAEGSGLVELSRHEYNDAMESGELGSTVFLHGGETPGNKSLAMNVETGVEEEVSMTFHEEGKKSKPNTGSLYLEDEQSIGEEFGIEYEPPK
jgi:hypothetical protein